jgi:hypothetical protein
VTARLGPTERESSLAAMGDGREFDVLVIGGGVVGPGRPSTPSPAGWTPRSWRPVTGRRHLVAIEQAHSWWLALSRDARHRTGTRGAARAVAAATSPRSASGQTCAVHPSSTPPRLGAGICRKRRGALRHSRASERPHSRCSVPSAPHQTRCAATGAVAAQRRICGGSNTGMPRSTTRGSPSAWSAPLPRTVPRSRTERQWSVSPRGRASGRRQAPGPGAWCRSGRPGEANRQRTGVWTDDTQAMVGERGGSTFAPRRGSIWLSREIASTRPPA